MPELTEAAILRWANDWHAAHGQWPVNEPVPPPTEGQLRWRIDRLRDHGVPMLAITRLLGLTVEEVEWLQQPPRHGKE
jgi:hypothetical protein